MREKSKPIVAQCSCKKMRSFLINQPGIFQEEEERLPRFQITVVDDQSLDT